MRKLFEIGGIVATTVLVVFGVISIAMGVNGRNTVHNSLALEQIVGSPDMNATAIAAEAKEAGLPASIKLPTADIAGKPINTGDRARAFATYMRIHALEATGGLTYAQMGRFLDKAGKPTSDEKLAAVNAKTGQPVENPLRNMWVTETALSTALNTSYFAESVATFAIVMGAALLLVGIGFLVVIVRLLIPAGAREKSVAAAPAVPASG